MMNIDPAKFFGRKPFYYHVRPRYTGGSPAMVPAAIAFRVASQEREDYEHALAGSYGNMQQARAELLGLRGIAYALAEHGSGRSFRWIVVDLITGEQIRRHHDIEIEDKFGFRRFDTLPSAVKQSINKTGRETDYDRTFWKLDKDLQWVAYEPELVR